MQPNTLKHSTAMTPLNQWYFCLLLALLSHIWMEFQINRGNGKKKKITSINMGKINTVSSNPGTINDANKMHVLHAG